METFYNFFPNREEILRNLVMIMTEQSGSFQLIRRFGQTGDSTENLVPSTSDQ